MPYREGTHSGYAAMDGALLAAGVGKLRALQ